MSNRISRLAIATLMVSAAQVSFAACQDGDVAGLTGKNLPGATGACASDTIDISRGDYAYTHNPPCPDGAQLSGPQISASIQGTISTAAGAVGSYYGGPLLGFAAQVTSTNTLHQVESMLGRNAASTTSNCGVLAVRLPPGSHVRARYGVAQDQTGRTVCGVGADCGGIGYSRMEPGQTYSDASGVYVTAVAKNWSGDRTRHFELLVYYSQ